MSPFALLGPFQFRNNLFVPISVPSILNGNSELFDIFQDFL